MNGRFQALTAPARCRRPVQPCLAAAEYSSLEYGCEAGKHSLSWSVPNRCGAIRDIQLDVVIVVLLWGG